MGQYSVLSRKIDPPLFTGQSFSMLTQLAGTGHSESPHSMGIRLLLFDHPPTVKTLQLLKKPWWMEAKSLWSTSTVFFFWRGRGGGGLGQQGTQSHPPTSESLGWPKGPWRNCGLGRWWSWRGSHLWKYHWKSLLFLFRTSQYRPMSLWGPLCHAVIVVPGS